MLTDKAFRMIRKHNKLQNKSFESDSPFFIWNLDESGFQANDSVLRVIGEKRRKLEKNCSDLRLSVTVVRVGCAGGDDGPVIFLLKGKKKNKILSDRWLLSQGLPVGSTVIMTEVSVFFQVLNDINICLIYCF